MDFYILCQNVLPVAIAVTVIVVSFYFWLRNSKGSSATREIAALGSENTECLTSDKDYDDEVRLDETIKPENIHCLTEDQRQSLEKEIAEQPITEVYQKNKIKEMNVKDASNIQTYYKSSRLGISEIENEMTKEELAQERETQQKQLEEIFKLLETDKDKFGVTTMDDLQAQMKLYSR